MSDLVKAAARNRAHAALDWVIDQTPIKIPPHLRNPFGWNWDADDVSLYALADSGEYRFHIEAETRASRGRRKKRRIAVLTVTDDDGTVKWEAEIPEGEQT